MRVIQKPASWLLALLCFVLGLSLRYYFFSTSVSHIPTTSDEALAVFIAQAIHQGARPLLFWGTPYQFPLESYLMAAFVPILEMNTFGARIVPFCLAALSIAGFMYVLRITFPASSIWPGVLLVTFPSAYVLTLQSGYFIPQYTMTLTYAWLLPMLAFKARSRTHAWPWTLACGFISGLALANHLLSIPLVASIIVLLALSSTWSKSLKHALSFLPAFFIGLIPYLLTMAEAKDVAQEVTGRLPLTLALSRFFSGVIHDTLSTVLGVTGCSFPDFHQWQGYFPWLVRPFCYAFWLLLLLASYKTLTGVWRRCKRNYWPSLESPDLFVLCTWACLFAFAFSARGAKGEYRYLLPVAWSLPFLITFVYTSYGRLTKATLGLATIALVLMNTFYTRGLIKVWQQPNFHAGTPDLHRVEGVIEYLKHANITHCYASFWFAYRLGYESNKRIICDQPQNERFLGWPLPFIEAVHASQNAAYVLTNTWSSRLTAKKFIAMLDFHRISFHVQQIGPFYVLHSFAYKDVGHSATVSPSAIQISSSDSSTSFETLIDDDTSSVWQSVDQQNEDMWLQITLDAPHQLHRLRLYFDPSDAPLAEQPIYRVELSEDGTSWSTIRTSIEPLADRVFMRETHPILQQNARQDISFAPQRARYLRIAVERTRAHTPWKFAEIELSYDRQSRPH